MGLGGKGGDDSAGEVRYGYHAPDKVGFDSHHPPILESYRRERVQEVTLFFSEGQFLRVFQSIFRTKEGELLQPWPVGLNENSVGHYYDHS